jgi:hypothetical protein
MSLRDELLAIREEFGLLTPENVVRAAEHPEHPLHNRFTWDNTEAAAKWRLAEAANLIRSVKIRFVRPSGESGKVRAFTRDPAAERPSVYDETEVVLENPVAREVILQQMRREWATFKSRYHMMNEFIDLLRTEAEALAAVERDAAGETA